MFFMIPAIVFHSVFVASQSLYLLYMWRQLEAKHGCQTLRKCQTPFLKQPRFNYPIFKRIRRQDYGNNIYQEISAKEIFYGAGCVCFGRIYRK